jgi:tripartite-type tricarboxylate transporter receptor subunit TctC
MQDLVAGQVDMMFDGLGTSATQINGGRLKGLALAAPKRSPTLPDVPTAKEAGLDGYEVSTWYALFAIKGTPPEAIEGMKQAVVKALQHPTIKEAWAKNGSEVPNVTGAELGALVKSEVARWGKVVRDANVKLEGN